MIKKKKINIDELERKLTEMQIKLIREQLRHQALELNNEVDILEDKINRAFKLSYIEKYLSKKGRESSLKGIG